MHSTSASQQPIPGKTNRVRYRTDAPRMMHRVSFDQLSWATSRFSSETSQIAKHHSLITMISILISLLAAGVVLYPIYFMVGTFVKGRALISLESSWGPSPCSTHSAPCASTL